MKWTHLLSITGGMIAGSFATWFTQPDIPVPQETPTFTLDTATVRQLAKQYELQYPSKIWGLRVSDYQWKTMNQTFQSLEPTEQNSISGYQVSYFMYNSGNGTRLHSAAVPIRKDKTRMNVSNYYVTQVITGYTDPCPDICDYPNSNYQQ